jgi:hypothetical protein
MSIWIYQHAYQIYNLDNTLDVKDTDLRNIETGSENGLVSENFVYLLHNTETYLALIEADFTHDLNWDRVIGQSDIVGSRSFIKNLTEGENTASSFSLFVPKRPEHDTLLICPEASALEEVKQNCMDGIVRHEQDENVSTVTIEGLDYWKVDGITGTGAISYSHDSLSETGSFTYVDQVIAIGIFILIRRFTEKHPLE